MKQRGAGSVVILGIGLIFFVGCSPRLRLAPVPQTRLLADHQQVRVYDFKGAGKPEYRQILDAGGQVRYHQFDPKGDGTFTETVDRNHLDPTRTRHLFLLLDGVPWSLIDQMWQEGYFRMFSRPGKMVSIFPALTDPAYDQIFLCGVPYGYEAEFYDRVAGRKVEGVKFYLSEKNETWATGVDYRMNSIEDAVMYIWPGGVFRRELAAARRVYDRLRDKQTVVLYLLSTDGICHMYTRERAREHFALLDRWIEQIVYEAHGQIEVTMLADHGNNFAGCHFVPICETLETAGLHVVDRLKKNGDVVAPKFGLISFASLFCYSDAERQRAVAALLPLEGVDAVAWKEGDDVRVANQHGHARISRRGGDGESLFRYQSVEGDPLGVLPAMARMQEQGRFDADGYAREQDWFAATCDLPLPAPVQRVYRSLRGNVINAADIVVSMADGYYYGDRGWEKFVTLHGTHGGLSQESTDSFLMSSGFEAPAFCRPQDVLPEINRHLAWTPHMPGVDYAWLDRYRREMRSPASSPAPIESASRAHPSASQPAPQAAIAP
jgi:hypothetical protein